MPAPTGLQQMSASVSGSLTRVHSLVRKAGTLLGPAAPGPTARSISDEEGKGWGGVLTEWLKAELVSSLPLLSRLLRRPLRTYSKASHGRSHLATGALSQRPDLYPLCAGAGNRRCRIHGPRPWVARRTVRLRKMALPGLLTNQSLVGRGLAECTRGAPAAGSGSKSVAGAAQHGGGVW